MNWTDDVKKLVDGEPADAAALNAPLQALVDRTDYLKNKLNEVTTNAKVIAYDVKLDITVEPGDFVYYDCTCGLFRKSLAQWSDSYEPNGELVASPTAQVSGVIINKSTENLGDLLMGGHYKDAALYQKIFGSNSTTGCLYYISGTDAGTVTNEPPPLAVPVVTDTGSDTFMVKVSSVHAPNHIHKHYVLTEPWLNASNVYFKDMGKPTGAVKGYGIIDTDFEDLFAAYPGELAVFVDGKLAADGDYVSNEFNLWWMGTGTDPSSAGNIEVYAYAPMTNGEPVIRNIKTNTPCMMAIKNENGTATIDFNGWTEEDVEPEATAIADIVDNSLKKIPVVTSITGTGLTVNKLSNGRYDLVVGDAVESLLDAELVNMNNTIELTDDPYFYYVFPAGRAASMTGKRSVPTLNPANTYGAAVWVQRRGITGGTSSAPINFPTMTVEITSVAHSPTTPVTLPAAPQVTTHITGVDSVQTEIYYGETPATDLINVFSNGVVYAKLSMPNNNYDKYILRFGIIIYLVSGTAPVVPPCG